MTPDILETELRDRLHRVAARSGSSDGDDRAAAEAVLVRRQAERRQRLVGLAVAACVALVVIAVPLVMNGLRSTAGGQAAAGEEVWDAPVRGSLADDRAFLDAVRLLDWSRGPAPEPADRQVAFAGDVPGGRWVLVVGPADGQLVGQWFTAGPGAEPVDLAADPSLSYLEEGDPVTRVAGEVPGGTLLVVTEPGDEVQVAERAVVAADGTVRRDFAAVPVADGVAVTEVGSTTESGIAARYRVQRDGAVVAEGMPAVAQLPGRVFDPPELTPLRPAGEPPDETAVDQAIAEVAAPLGLDEDTLAPVLLWSGPVPAPNGVTADAAVLALTLPSGAVVVSTAYADMAPDGSGVSAWCGAQAHPAGTLVAELAVVAACDVGSSTASDQVRLFLVSAAPGGASRVQLLRADGMVLAEQTVVLGTAVVRDSGAVDRARVLTDGGPPVEQLVTRGAPDGIVGRAAG
jgi:hypothetical protein